MQGYAVSSLLIWLLEYPIKVPYSSAYVWARADKLVLGYCSPWTEDAVHFTLAKTSISTAEHTWTENITNKCSYTANV